MAPSTLIELARSEGPIVLLTGAGISAESGIPTFRGPEGYWRVGSRAAETAAALVVVGTSGATTLPARICEIVAARGAPLVVIDTEPTLFSELAERSARGTFLRGTASAIVPSLIEELGAQL